MKSPKDRVGVQCPLPPLCPLSYRHDRVEPCPGALCAWWLAPRMACSMLVMAEELTLARLVLKQIIAPSLAAAPLPWPGRG